MSHLRQIYPHPKSLILDCSVSGQICPPPSDRPFLPTILWRALSSSNDGHNFFGRHCLRRHPNSVGFSVSSSAIIVLGIADGGSVGAAVTGDSAVGDVIVGGAVGGGEGDVVNGASMTGDSVVVDVVVEAAAGGAEGDAVPLAVRYVMSLVFPDHRALVTGNSVTGNSVAT